MFNTNNKSIASILLRKNKSIVIKTGHFLVKSGNLSEI